MKRFVRFVVGWLSGIGGALGLLLTLYSLLWIERLGLTGSLVLVAALAYFGFGMYAGFAAIRGTLGWTILALSFWAAQLLLLSLPVFAYFAAAPFGIWLLASPGMAFEVTFSVGSYFHMIFGSQPNVPSAVGINIAALAVIVALIMSRRCGEA